MPWLTWTLILVCIAHSAAFSGLNLALFGLGRLRLEIAAEGGDARAVRILEVRRDAHFLLTTILWGNVAFNCLLTLLSDSVMAGVVAFAFSTLGITLVGEILPQAYFSRNALRLGARLVPFIRFYQRALYPVARPSARLLDRLLGPEGIAYFQERDLRAVIEKHMASSESDLEHIEGTGALNFMALDDLPLLREGELLDPTSVVRLPSKVDLPVFPAFERVADDPFLRQVEASGRKWVVVCDTAGEPQLVLDADGFLRDALLSTGDVDPYAHCHRPIVVRDPRVRVGGVLRRLRVEPTGAEDDVIDQDLILLWTAEHKRIVTGADLLGRLMRGIASRAQDSAAPRTEG